MIIVHRLAGVGIVPVAVIISIALWFSPQYSVDGEEEVDVTVSSNISS